MSTVVPEFDTISDNGLLSRNEPIRSKVSKLTEKLRKRVPTNTTGYYGSLNTLFFQPLCYISLYDRSVFLSVHRKLFPVQLCIFCFKEKGMASDPRSVERAFPFQLFH